MAVASPRLRVSVDGKFFRLGEKKFYVKGVAYGPFRPDHAPQTTDHGGSPKSKVQSPKPEESPKSKVQGPKPEDHRLQTTDHRPQTTDYRPQTTDYGLRTADMQAGFASPDQTAKDFAQIKELGANVLRVYQVPEKWFLDLAAEQDLKVFVGIPWNEHLCFLDSATGRAGAREAVRNAVVTCGRHPAVFAYSVANELPADIVRWSGARRVADFIDELVVEAKQADPECLCTFTNFPTTEFLRPQGVDFVCFNVYLHQKTAFSNYLARLQMQAPGKPLLLGEVGIDSLREGEEKKCEMLGWQIEQAFRAGLAGAVVFSYTDEWWRGGAEVLDWQMGLVTRARKAKESFWAVREKFEAAPYFEIKSKDQSPKSKVQDAEGESKVSGQWSVVSSQKKAPKVHSPQSTVEEQRAEVSGQWSVVSGHKTVVNGRLPKVSVIVANYNGERTLAACLESLERLNYPDYEIILVDDGSTDTSPQIAYQRPKVRYFRHSRNLGLSAARNTGIGAATGEIVAFADSDCRADEDWLYYLVSDLLGGEFVGIGGPNLLPPEDSPVAAAVMASPGGPAHVMLTDRQAEHIPGCNMAFYKWALVEIGGFDPAFQRAGDDVDICWRLQQAGWKIGFSPAGFVWHYRRSTVAEYLRQQEGYGEAEALLVRKHPEYFNSLGGSMWKGRIYTTAKFGLLLRPSVIYRGLFASAGFQSLYAAEPAPSLMLCTAIEYHLFVTLPLWVLAAIFQNLLPLAIFGTLLPASVCAAAGAQAALPRRQTRRWSRALIALLFFLQPIVRGYARYKSRLLLPRAVVAPQQNLDSMALRSAPGSLRELAYWWQTQRSADSLVRGSPGSPAHTEAAALPSFDRLAFVTEMLRRLDEKGWPNRSDSWSDYDVEIFDARWSKVQITTVVEEHPGKGKFLHCRLKPGWSLRAKVSFGTACATELLLLGLLSAHHAWPWLLLISLPLFAWFLHHQGRALQSVLAVFLDELAKQTGLVKVRAEEVQAPKPETRSPKPEVQTPQSTVQLPKSEVIEGRGKQLPASSI